SGTLTLVDSNGNRLGGAAVKGHVFKEVPFADFLTIHNLEGDVIGYLGLIASPTPGALTIQIDRPANALNTPVTLSIVTPGPNSPLRQVVFNNITNQSPTWAPASGDPYPFSIQMLTAGVTATGPSLAASADTPIADPAPRVLGVVQQKNADALMCE